ncbi:MAG TPA: 2'-5' RNA ligase family protein [Ramlibacter sp.]|jgi:2'-5' RNA ligase
MADTSLEDSSPRSAFVHQTGLAIVMPEAESRFGALRQKFDPQAGVGVPAHITILFPFMPPELVDASVRRRLMILFKRFSPFRCVLAGVGRFPSTAYLAPVFPEPIVELTRAVSRAFPDYPPYGGAHESIVPHLTVANGDAAEADFVERELRADLQRNGPVATHCSRVKLLENSSGRWREAHEFALVGHQG